MSEEYKRYMVFERHDHHGRGGLEDCEASFDTLMDAKGYALSSTAECVRVFDRVEGVVVGEKE